MIEEARPVSVASHADTLRREIRSGLPAVLFQSDPERDLTHPDKLEPGSVHV